MNCEKATELWSLYCEKEIDPERKEELEEHLTTCRVCAEGLAAFQKTMQALKDLPALTPSPSFDARLARALAEESLKEREPWLGKFWHWSGRLAPAAASIAAVFAISFYLALQIAPNRESAPQGPSTPALTASEQLSRPLSSDDYMAASTASAPVRVEPWSIAGEWPQSPADSVMSGYTVRFVLDKIILEGEEAARSSVPQETDGVQVKYVTF
jgi:hypothetical protein